MNGNQQFNPNGFMPGVRPTGYGATPATTTMGNPMGFLASMAMSKQLGGIYGKSSSSSGSKVSIVKYDDHFKSKSKTWCQDNLVDRHGKPLSAEIIKENPPLCLKFKDCDVVVPIPSHKAMCATATELLEQALGTTEYTLASEDGKKEAAYLLSRALAIKYVEDCGYGAEALGEHCGAGGLPHALKAQTEAQAKTAAAERMTAMEAGTATDKRTHRDILGMYTST